MTGSEKFLCEPQELGVVNHKKKACSPVPSSSILDRKRQANDSDAAPPAGRLRMWPERASIKILHRQSFPTRNLRCLGRRKCRCGLCLDVMAFHRAKSSRSATGGATLTQPDRPTTILTNALHAQKCCLWLIHVLGPRSSCTQIHRGACLTAIFSGHWPPMSTTSNINAIQREEDKTPERRAWSCIIVFRIPSRISFISENMSNTQPSRNNQSQQPQGGAPGQQQQT
jgi:hypothetical protein